MSILRLSLAGTISAALALTAFGMNPGKAKTAAAEYSDKEEINQSFDLGQGAQVRINSINGTVKVETWDQPKAEIHIVKSTNEGPDELKRVDVIIDHSAGRLEIRTRHDESDNSPQVNVKVEVKLPRQMDLSISGVNGATDVGPITGKFRASGINGHVKVAESSEELSLDGINGGVTASLATLGSNGIRASGINGQIQIEIPEDTNATIDVTGQNGSFNSDLPLTMVGEVMRNQTHAQIGSGGTPIRMDGINGGIRLRKRAGRAM
jgi:hypothetical protein